MRTKGRSGIILPGNVRFANILFTCLFLFAQVGGDDKFCTHEKDPGDPPVKLSDLVKKSFTSSLFVVDDSLIETSRQVYKMREHRSIKAKKSSLLDVSSGDIRYHIYNDNTGKGYSDWDGKGCIEDPNSVPPYGFQSLKMFRDASGTYEGLVNSSSMEELHLWRNCYKNDDGKEVLEEIYTSKKNEEWGSPSGKDYEPVMLVTMVNKDGKDHPPRLNQFVMSFKYRDSDEDGLQADLQPPVGSTCDYKPEVFIPKFPESVVYSREGMQSWENDETYAYDTPNTIVSSEEIGRYQKTRKVDSYAMGVFFTINEYSYQNDPVCRITPYSVLHDGPLNKSISYDEQEKPFSGATQFLTGSDDTYTFNGEYSLRGIPTYAYTKSVKKYRDYNDIIIALYVAPKNVRVDWQKEDGKDSDKNFIVGKYVSSKERYYSRSSYTEDIYGMAPLERSLLDFHPKDILPCENELGSLDFTIQLKDPSSQTPVLDYTERKKLQAMIRESLSTGADINPLRVHLNELSVSSGVVTSTGKILGSVPYQKRTARFDYTEIDSSVVPDSEIIDHVDFVYSAESCKYLIWNKDDKGEMVEFCQDDNSEYGQGSCAIYKKAYTSSKSHRYNYKCTVFIRGKNDIDDTYLYLAWSNLQDKMDDQTLKVGNYEIQALSKIIENEEFDPEKIKTKDLSGGEYYKSYYQSNANVATTIYSDTEKKCAQACTESIAFECREFTYCPTDKKCDLHSAKSNYNNFYPFNQGSKTCQTYYRAYVSDFKKYAGISAVASDELIYENVQSTDDCALLCLKSKDIRCESFDSCTATSNYGRFGVTCALSSKHFLEVAASQPKQIKSQKKCVHYSRNYLNDYTTTEGVTSLRVTTTITGTDASACAKACSEKSNSYEGECSMFQYCAKEGTCQILDENDIPSSNFRKSPDVTAKLGCATYSLMDAAFRKHGLLLSTRASAESSGSGNYGSGAMAAVGMAMLVISFGAVFLGLFLWSRHQRGELTSGLSCAWIGGGGLKDSPKGAMGGADRSFDNPNMHFSKDGSDA